MRRTTLLAASLVSTGLACGNPAVAPPGTFYLSGTVTDSVSGARLEGVNVDVSMPARPAAQTLAQATTSAAGHYELTFPDSKCRQYESYFIRASHPSGGFLPASGSLPCKAKGSPYVVDMKLARVR